MSVQNLFNVAYLKINPVYGTLWTVEKVGDEDMVINPFPDFSSRIAAFNKAVMDGYGDVLIYEVDAIGWDRYSVFCNWSQDGVGWVPPAYINGIPQLNLGQPGQYALPNAYQSGIHLGPYPTTKPDGWITIPLMAQLLEPGVDVPSLLKSWFGV